MKAKHPWLWAFVASACFTVAVFALYSARQADQEIRTGKYRGPLHGIPFGVKDLFSAKGYRTTWGSVPYKEQVLDEDAAVVERLTGLGFEPVAETVPELERFIVADVARNAELLRIANFQPE